MEDGYGLARSWDGEQLFGAASCWRRYARCLRSRRTPPAPRDDSANRRRRRTASPAPNAPRPPRANQAQPQNQAQRSPRTKSAAQSQAPANPEPQDPDPANPDARNQPSSQPPQNQARADVGRDHIPHHALCQPRRRRPALARHRAPHRAGSRKATPAHGRKSPTRARAKRPGSIAPSSARAIPRRAT